MFKVLECISGEHDMRLVLLAAFVWILGSAAIFLLLGRSLDCVDARRRQWLAIAALAAGVGVWATHFIAMLAYRGAVPLRFAPGMTATSVVIAILAFWSAFLVLGREFRPAASGMAGLMAAIGVAAMHFAGMAAIDAPVAVRYDWPAIAAAFVLTAMIFVAAFWLFGKLKEKWRILLPASLAVAAVLLLHFTAMSATLLVPDPARGFPAAGTGDGWLVAATVVATIALIGLVLIGAFLDRLLTDLRGLTDATLEGLAVLSNGRILEANSQLAGLLGVEVPELIGSRAADWLVPADGEGLVATRDGPAE
ncbi:MAG TPA: MHYT domain-containing protein, partial [Sphingopyxis terrae]|nr:MHYT domain-containing protein [Sphingopyxis terrae]